MLMRLMGVLMLVAMVGLMAGCGGGGSSVPAVGTSSVEGTVYEPATATRAVADSAAGPNQGVPAGDCLVVAERARDRQRLRSTRTDAGGRYVMEGLMLGEDVLISAELPSGEQLMARLRIRNRQHQADITEDTTMAAACRQLLDEVGGGPPEGDDVDEIVGQICWEYQDRHRYQYGHHGSMRPDFSDSGAVGDAAADLLAAATDDAVATALQTRLRADCEAAVNMVVARLRQRERMEFSWDVETRTQAAVAMQNRWQGAPEQVAEAASGVLGCQASAGDIVQARDRLRERIREFQGDGMEAPEALGCLCLGDPDMDPLRLRTRDQVRQCLDGLLAG